MTQGEIIEQYKQATGERFLKGMYMAFVEKLGYMAPVYATFCNWAEDRTQPNVKILRAAIDAYPADDPRHQMAAQLMEVCYGGNARS